MSSRFKCNHSKWTVWAISSSNYETAGKMEKALRRPQYMKHALKGNPFLLTKAVPQSRRWQEPCTYQSSTALTQEHCPHREQPRCHPGLQKNTAQPKTFFGTSWPIRLLRHGCLCSPKTWLTTKPLDIEVCQQWLCREPWYRNKTLEPPTC